MQIELGRQVERYTIEALIGEGGQGRVFRVRHMQLGTEHALKVVLNATPGVRDRLLREGRAQAKLRHPNIVNVTDVIDVDGQPGLVMEFVRGPALDDLLHDQTLTIEQVDLLARGILEAMAHAHSHRFIHRDLKPANIMCAVSSRGLVPKVADFGLVKALGAEGAGLRQTRSGVMMGSAHYMSPEQIRSTKSVDERSDVWALGCILYEMLTGKVPFDGGEDLFEIFAAITSGTHTPIGEVRPDTPPRMRRAIESALVVDVDERVQDVGTLAALWRGEITHARESATAARSAWDDSVLSRYADGESLPPPAPSGEFETWADGTMDDAGAPPTLDDASAEPADSVPSKAKPNITQMAYDGEEPAGKQTMPTLAPAGTGQAKVAAPADEPAPVREAALPRERSKGPMLAGAALLLLVALAATGAVGAAMWSSASGDQPDANDAASAAVSQPSDAVRVPPEPTVGPADGGDEAVAAVEEPEVVPTPVAEPETVVVAPPRPTPPPSVPKAEPVAPKPAVPTLGKLSVSRAGLADGDQFFLVNASGTVLGEGDAVPSGSYGIQYKSGSTQTFVKGASVTVETGQSVTLLCNTDPACRSRVK
ncbi:MAG: protein kinase [Proteobacteria bacterium]|nr:protein kinase [Pseudomonadota bacterium]